MNIYSRCVCVVLMNGSSLKSPPLPKKRSPSKVQSVIANPPCGNPIIIHYLANYLTANVVDYKCKPRMKETCNLQKQQSIAPTPGTQQIAYSSFLLCLFFFPTGDSISVGDDVVLIVRRLSKPFALKSRLVPLTLTYLRLAPLRGLGQYETLCYV